MFKNNFEHIGEFFEGFFVEFMSRRKVDGIIIIYVIRMYVIRDLEDKERLLKKFPTIN